MKKFLALLLSVLMLLSACAFAEEAPATHSHRLSDLYIVVGDQILDFSELAIEVDAADENDPSGAGRIHLDANGETVAEIGVAEVDGLYVFHMDSPTLGHKDYVIDPVDFVAKYLDEGIAAITELLQKVDTKGVAQFLLNSMDEISEESAVEEPEETLEAEPEEPEEAEALTAPMISIQGDLIGVLAGCMSEPESVQMGGVEYGPHGTPINIADGTYTSLEFNMDTDVLCEILNMIYVDGEPSGWGDKVREAGIELTINGSYQAGETEGLNEINSCTVEFKMKDLHATVGVSTNKSYTEDGYTTAYTYGLTTNLETLNYDSDAATDAFSYTLAPEDKSLGLSYNVSECQHQGELFTADSIDMDAAVKLSELGNEEALDTLTDAAKTVGLDAMGAAMAPLMSALTAGLDLDALEAEAATAE